MNKYPPLIHYIHIYQELLHILIRTNLSFYSIVRMKNQSNLRLKCAFILYIYTYTHVICIPNFFDQFLPIGNYLLIKKITLINNH